MKRIISAVLIVMLMSSCSSERVSETVNVTEIELSENEITLYADKPDTVQIDAYVQPESEVVWSSKNESIAHIDAEGRVYPCGVGTTELIARAGELEEECTVNVTAEQMGDISDKFTNYPTTLYDMVMEQMKASPISYDTLNKKEEKELPAHDEEVEGFANPENFLTGHSKYQFLVLNKGNGIDAQTLDSYLNGKGALDGKGEIFKKAAEDNGVSELFLVLFACYETKNGTSPMAMGVQAKEETVYNVFGIDDKEIVKEERFAYEQGWTSLEKAIEGGARRLSDKYLNNSRYEQNTLYKMRWNPGSPGANQYTTEVEWADNAARAIGPMIEAFPSALWSYDIPIFEKGRAVAG